jgi:transcriptional regulator with AAA-type ATPase domain
MVAIKKYNGNQFEVLHFLLVDYKKPRCPSVYETLSRFNLYEWFTNTRELKSNIVMQLKWVLHFNAKKLHLLILEEYLELKDAFVSMLPKMKVVGQPLATCII